LSLKKSTTVLFHTVALRRISASTRPTSTSSAYMFQSSRFQAALSLG
jgi:hypothetical protein